MTPLPYPFTLLPYLDQLSPRLAIALGSILGITFGALLVAPSHPFSGALAFLLVFVGLALALTGRPRRILDHSEPHPEPDPVLGTVIALRGGEFVMGSKAYPDERPPHRVLLSPFSMGRTAVTNAQWNQVMGDSRVPLDHPVTRVSWYDALRFCNAASLKAGLPPCYQETAEGHWVWIRESPGYRLPTEAEWEMACRAGSQGRFCFGDGHAQLEEYAWYGEHADGSAHPVARRESNGWGLHDMHGNVWEWCWDRYDSGAYKQRSGSNSTDPVVDSDFGGRNTGHPKQEIYRVVRGGSFYISDPETLRSATRDWDRPDSTVEDLGFRCLRGSLRQP